MVRIIRRPKRQDPLPLIKLADNAGFIVRVFNAREKRKKVEREINLSAQHIVCHLPPSTTAISSCHFHIKNLL